MRRSLFMFMFVAGCRDVVREDCHCVAVPNLAPIAMQQTDECLKVVDEANEVFKLCKPELDECLSRASLAAPPPRAKERR